MGRSKCERKSRLSHRSHNCEVDLCSQRFGKEQQLKEHMRKDHSVSEEFGSKGGENLINSTDLNFINLEENDEVSEDLDEGEVAKSEDPDEEEIFDKFKKLAIFDATSSADKKDNFVKLDRRNWVKNEQEKLAIDWVQSKMAIQRMKGIMRGEFDSRRHKLFLERYILPSW